ncbi:MAG: hypothetical protein IPL32_19075 [Chloracidobacterium sp.]|nr:hypothetical protein [Chloracidobacterium sp.]
MHLNESSFYHLPYYALAKFLENCQASKRDSAVYTVHLHQEAIDVLLDRMERAQSHFDRKAFELLIHAPVIVGENSLRGFIRSIISDPRSYSFLIRVWIPDLNQEIDISYATSFTFDLALMPNRSVHAKVKTG